VSEGRIADVERIIASTIYETACGGPDSVANCNGDDRRGEG
jgi:hypothetical protein